ncbi:radical SAM protein [Geomonas sp. RF6]|uniref:radical SAM protein n=1 Tax=Geomonas sp. RF6 TaxID=2897342 RepID=UPI001E503A0E|nr:radical SAM protein [Geomonas sp. RF6]UFS71042.1 radical SAM protein [Geomonas sp. RF6]
MKRYSFDIDVTGACNLRCPCCPQGNLKEYRLPHGFIDPQLLEKIVAKATSEAALSRISLFSWAEPLLHPEITELVRIVRRSGTVCYLSSNLNLLPDPDALMAANPDVLRISASGFTQGTYGRFHRGGDVERVKKHMVELAEARKRRGASTRIYVYYHRYRGNLKEEPLMRDFARELGFGFQSVWALLFPLEKILPLADGGEGFPLTEEDRQLMAELALPVEEALAVAARHSQQPCALKDGALSIDFRGDVQLCCGIFDASRFTIGNYLEMPLAEIQRLRAEHPMCRRCIRGGGHVYLCYGARELAELAVANVAADDRKLLGLKRELARRRVGEMLLKVSAVIPEELKWRVQRELERLSQWQGGGR